MASVNQPQDSDDNIDQAEVMARYKAQLTADHSVVTQLGFFHAEENSFAAFYTATALDQDIRKIQDPDMVKRFQDLRDSELKRSVDQMNTAQTMALLGNTVANDANSALSAKQLAAITGRICLDRKPGIEAAWRKHIADNRKTDAELQAILAGRTRQTEQSSDA